MPTTTKVVESWRGTRTGPRVPADPRRGASQQTESDLDEVVLLEYAMIHWADALSTRTIITGLGEPVRPSGGHNPTLRARRPVLGNRAPWTLLLTRSVLLMIPKLVVAPAPTEAIREAIRVGRKLEQSGQIIDIVDSDMVHERYGTSEQPSWALVAGSAKAAIHGGGGRQLASVDSLKLLRRQSFGVSTTNQNPAALRGLLAVPLLEGLFAVDPTSYAFAYALDGKFAFVPTPLRLEAHRVPKSADTSGLAKEVREGGPERVAEMLPPGVARADLMTILRRSGLQLITSGL